MPVGVPQRRGGFTTICTKLVTLPYKLVHMGQSPTSAANGASKTRLDLQRGWGEYGEVTYTNSPDCLLNRGSFRSFGFASLVGLCPTPQQGAALHPPGGPVRDDACRHRLDSHARLEKRRSLIALRCAFFFPLPTSHSPLNFHLMSSRHALEKIFFIGQIGVRQSDKDRQQNSRRPQQ